ncbi:MAG TPA: hypothetical protein VF744_20630 [Beijerinckiaceae bacterium]|jgi:hypothetical protein
MPTTGPNLVVNGSFEDLNSTGDNLSAALIGMSHPFFGMNWTTSNTLYGWRRTTPYPFELVKTNNIFTGATSPVILDLEFNGGQNSIIYQDIPGLTAGATYHLMFDTAQYKIPSSVYTASLQVWWNGVKVATVNPSGPPLTFVTTAIDVVAAAAGTGVGGMQRLEFREAGAGADGLGTALDNVRLYANCPNLVVNGSFEDLNSAGDNLSAALIGTMHPFFGMNWNTSNTLYGWRRATPYPFELIKPNNVFTGATSPVILDLEFNGAQNCIIYQDIPGLTAGATYHLMFDTAQYKIPNHVYTASLQVWWNGVKVATVNPSGPPLTFVTTAINVVAAAAGTGVGGAQRLEFREAGAGADGLGTALDNVRLYPPNCSI